MVAYRWCGCTIHSHPKRLALAPETSDSWWHQISNIMGDCTSPCCELAMCITTPSLGEFVSEWPYSIVLCSWLHLAKYDPTRRSEVFEIYRVTGFAKTTSHEPIDLVMSRWNMAISKTDQSGCLRPAMTRASFFFLWFGKFLTPCALKTKSIVLLVWKILPLLPKNQNLRQVSC